jgi:hypothetical protein
VALDTANKRASSVGLLGLMLAPPIPDGALSAGDRQHVSWSYSGILAATVAALAFVLDLNTRLLVFLRDHYSVSGGDLTSLATRYLAGLSGDYNVRFRKLIQDATDAMS